MSHFVLGRADAHIVAKILDHADDEQLRDWGMTDLERRRAEWVFEDLDFGLSREIGANWVEQEVQ